MWCRKMLEMKIYLKYMKILRISLLDEAITVFKIWAYKTL